jgi:hypothetical protein
MHSKLLYKPIERIGGETPGPGNYNNPIVKQRNAPAYGLGSEKRDFESKSTLDVPASNTYNPAFAQTEKKGA